MKEYQKIRPESETSVGPGPSQVLPWEQAQACGNRPESANSVRADSSVQPPWEQDLAASRIAQLHLGVPSQPWRA